MTRIFSDTFDSYSTAPQALAARPVRYDAVGQSSSLPTTAKFTGTRGYLQNHATVTTKRAFAAGEPHAAMHLGAWMNPNVSTSAWHFGWLVGASGSTLGINLDAIGNTNQVRVRNGTTVLATIAWAYTGNMEWLSFSVVTHATAGSIVVYLGSYDVPSERYVETEIYRADNINTVVSSNTEISGFQLLGVTRWDDLNINNGAGSVENGLVKHTRNYPMYPVADTDLSGYNAWSMSTGSVHWSLADEIAPNTSDFVSSNSTADAAQLFNMSVLPTFIDVPVNDGPIAIVTAYAYVRAAAAGSLVPLYRPSGSSVVYEGPPITLITDSTFRIQWSSWLLDPATGVTWLAANINSGHFGFLVRQATASNVDVSQFSVEVAQRMEPDLVLGGGTAQYPAIPTIG